jgi:hypothetical protein
VHQTTIEIRISGIRREEFPNHDLETGKRIDIPKIEAPDREDERARVQPLCHVTHLFVDERGPGHARRLVLRAGTTGATDSPDDLAILDQRNAAAHGNHVVQSQ